MRLRYLEFLQRITNIRNNGATYDLTEITARDKVMDNKVSRQTEKQTSYICESRYREGSNLKKIFSNLVYWI